jgi:hypothetical protein
MQIIRRIFALLLKTTLLTLLIIVLIPIPYFAGQMGKPLPQPEFKGLTYYQYFAWRRMATENVIAKYMVSHPDFEYTGIGEPMTSCYSGRVYIMSFLGPLQAFSYTISALTGQKPNEMHPLPTNVTLVNFLPKWWDTFEYLFWYNQIHLDSFGSLVAMCRLQPNIPTPEEFEAMKSKQQLSTVQ